MSYYPHTRLFPGVRRTVVVSGPHIQILDTTTGDTLHSTRESEDVLKTGPIRCAVLSADGSHLATAADDKILKVWSMDRLEVLSRRELPKKPTDIRFILDGHTILVSDKFGDIFSYPLNPPPPTPVAQSELPMSKAAHSNPSGGSLILGHASLLTTFLLSPDERYIVTADRDEHIRVSWFPQGWSVERYCLGHKRYVSAVHIPPAKPAHLISGGGDPTLKIWDWMSGDVLGEVHISDAVLPFLKVRPNGRKRSEGQRRKMRGKGEGGQERGDEVEMDEDSAEHTPAAETPDAGPSEGQAKADEPVLVVHKIDTFGEASIIFSAVGATALFLAPYPATPSSSEPSSPVSVLDLGVPILDFVLDANARVWVLLDPGYVGERKAVRVVWREGAQLVTADTDPVVQALLAALTGTALISAPHPLTDLDFYAPLSLLPKRVHGDEEEDGEGLKEEKVTKRALGRAKRKQALLVHAEGRGEEGKDVKGKKARNEDKQDGEEEGIDQG